MRLWHYKLTPYLPKKMLVSQWRELIAIKRQWEKETLIHPLVSYVKNYDKTYFSSYTYEIYTEMLKREINCRHIFMKEILEFSKAKEKNYNVSYFEHDNEYLKICYYNLKEKYLRGIVKEDEWKLLDDFYQSELIENNL